jgi:hypothetical protein
MGVLEALPTEEQAYLRDLAEDITEMDADSAVRRIEAENLEAEQKIGLWSILDSKTRSAIKKAQQSMKEAA